MNPQRITYKTTCPGCEGTGKIAVSSGEPPCPFCPYEDANGKTHDPLSTVRDRNIHRETHRYDHANGDHWYGAKRCTEHAAVTHHRCDLPEGHNGMHHCLHFLWDERRTIRHDEVGRNV